MACKKPPTLREILSYKKPTDSDIIDVSQHNYKNPENPKSLYHGSIDAVPDDILDLRILAWVMNLMPKGRGLK